MKSTVLGILLCSFILSGCALPALPALTPTPLPTAATTPLLSVVTGTDSPTPETPAAPSESQVPTATERTTATPIPTLSATPLPDVTAPVTGTFTRLTRLSFDAPVHDLRLSPNAQWLTYLALSDSAPAAQPVRFGPGPSTPQPARLHAHHIASGNTWEVTRDCSDMLCEYAWLSRGLLIWREQGEIYLADAAGENRRTLNAPDRIIEILGVTPDDIVVLRGEGALWRLYMPQEQWDVVPEPLSGPAPTLDIARVNDRLYLSNDNHTALVAYTNHPIESPYAAEAAILYLPLAPGAAPTAILPLTALYYPRTERAPQRPPIPLQGTTYWMPDYCDGIANMEFAYCLLDSTTGAFVPLDELLIPPGYGQNSIPFVSPDGRWMARILYQPLGYVAPGESTHHFLYVAPTDRLAHGQILDMWGEIAGWQSEPPALYFHNFGNSDAESALVRYDLLNQTATTLFASSNGFGSTMISSESVVLLTDAAPGELTFNAFTLDGVPLTRDDAPGGYPDWLGAEGNRFFFVESDWDGTERRLWMYEVPLLP